jgi:hypothetical protein
MKVSQSMLQGCILAAAVLFLLISSGPKAAHGSFDFVTVYAGSSCLIHGCDPYNVDQLEKQYLDHGGKATEQRPWEIEVPVYPPATLLTLAPLALVSFPAARLIWLLLNAGLLVTAVLSILQMCPEKHRWLASILGALLLAGSGQLLILGQPGAFAISLVAIGTYLFLRGRYLPLAAVLLALSLAVKPQIGGLIVLYLLVRGVRRWHAAAAMTGAVALLVAGGLILNSNPASSNWLAELRGKIAGSQAPGGINDPTPNQKDAMSDLHLQCMTSVFDSDPKTYNAAAFAVFAVLLAVWAVGALRTKPSLESHWLAIGGLAVLTLMPVYHRFYDSRLLVLALPAALLVFSRHWVLGAAMGATRVVEAIAFQFRGLSNGLMSRMGEGHVGKKLLFILLLREQSLGLLALACLLILALYTVRFPETPGEEKPA